MELWTQTRVEIQTTIRRFIYNVVDLNATFQIGFEFLFKVVETNNKPKKYNHAYITFPPCKSQL